MDTSAVGGVWRRKHGRLVREMGEIQLSGWVLVRGAAALAAHFNTNMNPSRVLSVGRVLVNLEPGPRIPASVGSGRPGQLKLIFRYYSQIKIH